LYYHLDVTDSTHITLLPGIFKEKIHSPLRGVVCCAGISGEAPALDYDLIAFQNILNVNVMGTFAVVQVAAKEMIAYGLGGSVILIASISGSIANRNLYTTAYSASKAAVQQMGRSLAAEWGTAANGKPIRVNSISPGYIDTPISAVAHARNPKLKEQNMLGRNSVPNEFRAPVLFLLGDGSSFVTGSDLRVDGGHCAW
jgi:NAD(P)-dependent dehydrogenase (short-subunit alcohol dehydrogenase family)